MPEAGRSRQVVVLAGGLGTRMRMDEDVPKALVPVRGEPFAHHQLRLLASQGVERALFVLGFRGDRIRAAVGDGRAFGPSVEYVDEGETLHGTGGALRVALDEGALESSFGVLYGDSYLPFELAPVWAAHAESGRSALLTVLRNEDRWDRSNAVFENGAVLLYDKRPERRDPRMRWIDYGFSVLTREVVEEIPSGAPIDLGDVYRELSLRGALAGYEVTSRFYEVGSPEGLADLEEYLGTRAPYPPRP